MNRNLLKILLAAVTLLWVASPAMAQYNTFIVDDDGNPLTTYPDLATAINTANTFAGGPHKIIIMPGNYDDAGLTPNPLKIDAIYGDSAAAPGDIVFTHATGPTTFLTAGNDLYLANMTLVGYAGYGVLVNGANVTVENMVIEGASGTGVYINNVDGAIVQNLTLMNLQFGVYASAATNALIKKLDIDDCDYGVALYNFTTNSVVDDLDILGGDYGVYLDGGSTGVMVQNSRVEGVSQYGIWLNSVGGSRVENNLVYNSGSWGVILQGTPGGNPNWVRFNCLIGNTGASQGYDDQIADLWDGNFYGDNVYTMSGAGCIDANPMKYMLKAEVASGSYNLGDTVAVDFTWSMPICATLDSQYMAAYNFVVGFDDTKLAYVPSSAGYDELYLGSAPEALYTAIGVASNSLTFAAANFTTPGLDGGRLAFAKFVVIAANTNTTFAFSAEDFRDPANNPVPYSSSSDVFNLVDNVPPVLVSATEIDPIGDDTYSDGSTAGLGPFYQLNMVISATDNYSLDRIQQSWDGGSFTNLITGLSGTAYTSPPKYMSKVATLIEGAHSVTIRVLDDAGLISNTITYNLTIDRTAPVITTVTISDKDLCALDNSRWTNDSVVTLAIAATGDPATMMVSEVGDKPIIPFAASSDFIMTGVNGAHTVWVRLYDKYNNRVDWTASNAITLDNVAPIAVGPLLINGGAAKTNNVNVALAWTSLGLGGVNMGERKASEDVSSLVCGTSGWAANAAGPPLAFVLSAGDTTKTVYLASRDSAGNISNVLSSQIVLDQTPIAISSYVLKDLTDFECTNDGQIKAIYQWSGTDAATLEYSFDDATWNPWKSLVGETSPDTAFGAVPVPNAINTLYIRIVDDVANAGPSASGSIEYDNTAPVLSTMVVADAAGTATPDPTDPQYTNNTTFNVNTTGLTTDVVALQISQDNVTYVDFPITPADPLTLSYPWTGTATECASKTLWVRAIDCAGNVSVLKSDAFRFDFTAPTLTSFSGPAVTNTATVSLSIAASDNCGLYRMRLGQTSLVGVPWVNFNPSPSYTITGGDGNHTILLEVADHGGNIVSGSWNIFLDATPPGPGTFVIVSGNPLAAGGYTNSLSGNIANIQWDGDVDSMYIQYADGSVTGTIPVSSPYALAALPDLPVPGPGIKSVNYWFKDAANNWSAMYSASIDYNNVAPLPPTAGTATGIPGGSCMLEWGPVTDAKSYLIRYNFQNQYPTYQDPIPPHPANFGEGILAASGIEDTTYDFEGPQPDIYSFSIWTLSKWGIYSPYPNTDVTATNYILGSFNPVPDSCIDFADEFGELAIAYNSVPSDPNWNVFLDIAPTIDSQPTSYPVPDGAINFEDLVIFALNYDEHFCTGSASETGTRPATLPKLIAGPLDVKIELPDRVANGGEFTVPVTISNYEAVKAFHVVFDVDQTKFEVVNVEAGAAFEGIRESFFNRNMKSDKIDISGTVFGRGVTWSGEELFTITLKAKAATAPEMESVELTFRDRQNTNFDASLSVGRVINTSLPTAYALSQNYPNPFNPSTTIELALPVAGDYTLTIYNVLGQTVKTYTGHSEAGYVTINWDASSQASGIYLYKVVAGSFESTKKMILVK